MIFDENTLYKDVFGEKALDKEEMGVSELRKKLLKLRLVMWRQGLLKLPIVMFKLPLSWTRDVDISGDEDSGIDIENEIRWMFLVLLQITIVHLLCVTCC